MRRAALVGLVAAVCANAHGHEVRPAYLQIEAVTEDSYEALWKQPTAGGRFLPLAPVFPAHCTVSSTAIDEVTADALVRRFRLECPGGLVGGTIAVDGLSRTITDVMLHVRHADGATQSTLLKPASPAAVIGDASPVLSLGYLVFGIEHLLFGFDHILFVLSLLYFLHRVGALVKAVTAFTAAHSITLGLSALDVVGLPQTPVESVIALSILFLAVEKLRGEGDTITARHTWVVAFAFGLLHGFGFAGALSDIGLPKDNLLVALLLFNIGVEVGQLAVVAVALTLVWVLRRCPFDVPRRVALVPLYCSGCLAAYWFVGRTVAIVA